MEYNPTEIADEAIRCAKAFGNLEQLVLPDVSILQDRLQFSSVSDDHGRFNIWAGNIGAYRVGPASLDSRLAEVALVRGQILKLLKDLNYSLDEATSIASGARPERLETVDSISDLDTPGSEISSVDSDSKSDRFKTESVTETEESKDGPLSELQQLQACIRETITGLFMLSIAIRNSAPRDRYAKSDKLPTLDDNYDIDYVWQKFPDARTSGWLIDRLGKAITRRRQYFRYRSKHSARLSRRPPELGDEPGVRQVLRDTTQETAGSCRPNTVAETRDAGQALTMIASSQAPTTATPYEPPDADFDGISEAAESVSSVVSSLAAEGQKTRLRIPPPPIAAADENPFECPYCHEIYRLDSKSNWKHHVLKDLQPYVCTFKSCSPKLYPNKEQWWQHELQMHRNSWICNVSTCRQQCSSKGTMREHLFWAHPGLMTNAQVPLLLELCNRPMTTFFAGDCPLCDYWAVKLQEKIEAGQLTASNTALEVTAKQFRNHVAKHLLHVALYALPKIPEQDEIGDRESGRNDQGTSDSDSGSSMSEDLPIKTTKAGLPTRPTHWESNVRASKVELVLYKAAQKRAEDLVIALRSGQADDADLAATAVDGKTALHQAARDGDLVAVEALYGAGADLHAKDMTGSSAVHLAADQGRLAVVQFLLDRGADMEDEDSSGATVLRRATGKGHIEIMQICLSRGADVDSPDKKLSTPLHRAAERGHADAVRLLLKHRARVDAPDINGYTPLHRAINRERYREVVEVLLQAGADINTRCKKGPTPLQTAAAKNHVLVSEFLISNGADVNMTGPRNMRAVHNAIYNGHAEVLEVLLRNGADATLKDDDGWDSLYGAASMGGTQGLKLVATVINYGQSIDLDSRDNTGKTALHRAVVQGHIETIKVLVSAGADLDALDEHKRSPLHFAVASEQVDLVQILVQGGGNAHVKDVQGQTPIDMARKKEMAAILTILCGKKPVSPEKD